MNVSDWTLSVNQGGHLSMAACDLVEVADCHGTPLYVVDEAGLRGTYRAFVRAFRRYYPSVEVFYSYKTNCVAGLIEVLDREGCGAEVVSPYELWLALRLGVEPDRIIYNGVHKSPASLRVAIERGVRLVHINSRAEADHVIRLAADLQREVNVGLRVQPQIGWGGQFGIQADADELVETCKSLRSQPLCKISCVSAHIGSGIRSAKGYAKTARYLCRVARRIQDLTGAEIRDLDVGGGFGVPTVKTLSVGERAFYKHLNRRPQPPDSRRCASVDAFARAIGDAVQEEYRRSGLQEPKLLLEPGRAISSSSQVLLVRVCDIRDRPGRRTYVITDGGMQNIAFPLSYEYHHCLVANRASDEARHTYFVTGPLCSPEDILYRNWRLPKLAVGDVLAVMDAGAYFTSYANNFSFPRPPVAMVSHGRARIVRRRETFDHLAALDRCDAPALSS